MYGVDINSRNCYNYRLAPETQFPGPLQDVLYAYLWLLEDFQIPPENIIIGGDTLVEASLSCTTDVSERQRLSTSIRSDCHVTLGRSHPEL